MTVQDFGKNMPSTLLENVYQIDEVKAIQKELLDLNKV